MRFLRVLAMSLLMDLTCDSNCLRSLAVMEGAAGGVVVVVVVVVGAGAAVAVGAGVMGAAAAVVVFWPRLWSCEDPMGRCFRGVLGSVVYTI